MIYNIKIQQLFRYYILIVVVISSSYGTVIIFFICELFIDLTYITRNYFCHQDKISLTNVSVPVKEMMKKRVNITSKWKSIM